MDVIAAANARQAALPPGAPHVIRMEVGQPGTGAPAGAVAAATAALRSGDPLGYTEAFGRRSLRERIVAHYRDWYGLDVPVERVAVTVGASGAFPLAFLAAFDPGDRVALTSPFYPPYVNILTALGMQPVILEAGPETRFQPSVAMLERLDPPPDGLIVASPCNPAGTMLHPDELAAIAAWCDGAGVRLISDEIYHGLNYDSPIATAAGAQPACRRGEQLLASISHDGLADRLAGAARGSGAAGRAPGAESVHQRAAYLADRGRGGVRLPRRTCRRMSRAIAARAIICCARCRLPVSPGCRPAEGAFYLFADIADRIERQRRVLRADAGGGRDRGDAGRGFRPRARQPVPALQLLRAGGRHARSGGAARGLAIGLFFAALREEDQRGTGSLREDRRHAVGRARCQQDRLSVAAARREVPDIFVGGGLELDGEEREWVPQSADVSFRPLVLCVSQGYYITFCACVGLGFCRGIAIPGRCTRSLCAGAGAIWSMIGSRNRATMPSSRRARRTRWWCRRAWPRWRRCFTSRMVTLYVDPYGKALGYEDVFYEARERAAPLRADRAGGGVCGPVGAVGREYRPARWTVLALLDLTSRDSRRCLAFVANKTDIPSAIETNGSPATFA